MTIRGLLSKLKRGLVKIGGIPSSIVRMPGDVRIGRLAQNNLVLKVETDRLFLMQSQGINSGMMSSMLSVIVKYLAIEEFFGKNNYGTGLYAKLKKRLEGTFSGESDYTHRSLENFAMRVSKDGFSYDDTVLINDKQIMISGSNVLSTALYFDIEEVSVEITSAISRKKGKGYGCVDNKCFKDCGFTNKEIEIIQKRKEALFLDRGLYFPGVLWGPVLDYFEKIIKRLSKKHRVVVLSDYTFKTEDDFFEMLQRLYSWEAISLEIIKKKFEALLGHPHVVRFFYLEIPEPAFKMDGKQGIWFSSVVKDIKEALRREYSKKIDNYIRDIVIHLGDNFEHNRHILEVIEDTEKG